ncbi:MAG TPA: type II toxin-antitoxin system PemK/MazF family toxin [Tissierellaceae bacterium]|nr:type II toxin-antitoxin system PemK/MazF family toxin [Tissierellaceae bacterium]
MKHGSIYKRGCSCCTFPFSDLSNSIKRPALVLANLQGDDLILAQITSQTIFDSYSISVESDDFSTGKLKMKSNIRPNKIFTAEKDIILYKIGSLEDEKIDAVIEKIIEIFAK